MRKIFKNVYSVSVVLLIGMAFLITGCDNNNNPTSPGGTTQLASVTNVKLTLGQTSNYYAIVSWSGIADNNRTDFTGYTVVTYNIDATGGNGAKQDSAVVGKTTTSYTISSLQPAKNIKHLFMLQAVLQAIQVPLQLLLSMEQFL